MLIIVLIIAPFVVGTGPDNRNKHSNKGFAKSVQQSIESIGTVSMKAIIFDPIEMNSKVSRKGAAIDAYRAKQLQLFSAQARQNNPNMIMTGESCALGTGSCYKVLVSIKSNGFFIFNAVTKSNLFHRYGDALVYYICFKDKVSSVIFTMHKLELANKSMTIAQLKNYSIKRSTNLYLVNIVSKFNQLSMRINASMR